MGAAPSAPSAAKQPRHAPTERERPAPTPPARDEWKAAFQRCSPTLEALALAQDEAGRLGSRAWFVVCMARECGGCGEAYHAWKAEAAAALPPQLTAAHTETAVALPGWERMAQCVVDRGRSVGVEVERTLDHVERKGAEIQAKREWERATGEVEPLRTQLRSTFLSRGVAQSAAEMSIDELRVCQIYFYGLASRLQHCHEHASAFAREAGMSDPNTPLLGYAEERWDPRTDVWQRMEMCIHEQAANAGTEADYAWRSHNKAMNDSRR